MHPTDYGFLYEGQWLCIDCYMDKNDRNFDRLRRCYRVHLQDASYLWSLRAWFHRRVARMVDTRLWGNAVCFNDPEPNRGDYRVLHCSVVSRA